VDSLTGRLLVSSPALVDPNFRRTVVLVTHHDDEGAAGLVLSRPSELEIASAVPELTDLPCVDDVIYIGGPVQPEAVVVLVEFEPSEEGAETIIGGVGFLPPERSSEELALRRARVFAGYSGWGPSQLESELEEEAWIVVTAEPDDAFATDADALWRTVAHRKGGPFTFIATMPFDPGLN
jgi:putative transcriptional regulator